MCSAENYSVVGPCTPNFRRLRRGRSRPRRPLFLIPYGIDFYPLIGISSQPDQMVSISFTWKLSCHYRVGLHNTRYKITYTIQIQYSFIRNTQTRQGCIICIICRWRQATVSVTVLDGKNSTAPQKTLKNTCFWV